MSTEISEQAKRFFEAMNAIHRLAIGRRQTIFKKIGLSPQQVEVVYFLADGGPKTIKEIAAVLNATSSAATQVVLGLEKQRIVKRQADKKDRRAVRVSLTAAGRKKISEFRAIHLKNIERVMTDLTSRERELLISIPPKLIKFLKTQ